MGSLEHGPRPGIEDPKALSAEIINHWLAAAAMDL
jgi:hypothetical protein